MKHLGIDVDQKLRFEDYVQRTTGKASQRMYVFKKKIVSELQAIGLHTYQKYCSFSFDLLSTRFVYRHLCQRQKSTKKCFQDAQNLGLEVGNLDTIVRQRTTTQLCAVFLMQIISYTIF